MQGKNKTEIYNIPSILGTLKILNCNCNDSLIKTEPVDFNDCQESQNAVGGMVTIADPDQTALQRSSLIWVYTVCSACLSKHLEPMP